MRKLLYLFIFTSITCNSQIIEKNELIRKSFENYKKEIINENAREALKYLDSRTIKYYTDILDKTINIDSLSLNSLSVLDKFTILSIRFNATKDEILTFDGNDLFVFLNKQGGVIDKRTIEGLVIGEIEYLNEYAKGELLTQGKKTPYYLFFYNENDDWKINLNSMLANGEKAIVQMINQSGKSENEFLDYALEVIANKNPKNKIWESIR